MTISGSSQVWSSANTFEEGNQHLPPSVVKTGSPGGDWQRWLSEKDAGQENRGGDTTNRSTAGPGVHNSSNILPERVGCLMLRRREDACGVFGIGLSLRSGEPGQPHISSHTQTLKVGGDLAVPGMTVSDGDTLVGINGCPVEASSTEIIEQLLLGDYGTTAHVTLTSSKNGLNYDVPAVRHVPVRTWDSSSCWYELRAEVSGAIRAAAEEGGEAMLAADPRIVRTLEQVRSLVCSPEGDAKDLLKNDTHCQTTLGFRVAFGQGGECIISQVITGSALHMEGEALEGDVIMAVDGVHLAAVDQETAAELLRKNDKVGNKSILTLSRGGGAPFRVTVVHSSVAGVREMERLCYLLEDHAQLIKNGSDQESMIASAQAVMDQALGMEQQRVAMERATAERLEEACLGARDGLLAALAMLRPPSKGGSGRDGKALEEERAGRMGAEARAADWERRLDVLKDLVQVLRGPPSVSPNKLAMAMSSSGLSPAQVVELLSEIGRSYRGMSVGEILSQGGRRAAVRRNWGGDGGEGIGGGGDEAKLNALNEGKLRAEAEANVLRRRCESLQRQLDELSLPPVSSSSHHAATSLRHGNSPRVAPTTERGIGAGGGGEQGGLTPPPPTIIPRGATSSGPTTAKISVDAGAARDGMVYYTTNGSHPTTTHFEGRGQPPITVTLHESCTLRAVLISNGRSGPCASATFSIQPPPGRENRPLIQASAAGRQEQVMAGVGLLLETSQNSNAVYVKSIMTGGAAAIDGKIHLWDKLLAVDGFDVQGTEFAKILELIKGPEGTRIVLSMERGPSSTSSTPGSAYTVTLTRSRVQAVGIVGSYSSPTGGPHSRSPSPTPSQ